LRIPLIHNIFTSASVKKILMTIKSKELNVPDLRDPRVFFAAERTLLAWNRTSLTLMSFGFVIERFGLFLHMISHENDYTQKHSTFWVGIIFIILGVILAIVSSLQYQRFLRTLTPSETPAEYWKYLGMMTNIVLAALGIAITIFLFSGFQK